MMTEQTAPHKQEQRERHYLIQEEEDDSDNKDKEVLIKTRREADG